MAQKAKRRKAWSYIAGKKGINRIRAYEDSDGSLLLEWHEPLFDNTGAVIDPRTGTQKKKRQRISLTAAGVTTRAEAIKKAEDVALRIGDTRKGAPETGPERTGPVTLGYVLALYFKEVVPYKKPDTQRQNDADRRMYLAYYGPDAVVERIGPDGRPRTELGRVRYNDFIRARMEGTIEGFAKAKGSTIKNDVRFLRAVFRWAKQERDDGTVLLIRNPWEGFPDPACDIPVRKVMTPELHQKLAANARNWRMAVVMEICRETRRRVNSVRQLSHADLDLENRLVRWQGEHDKVGKTRVTPLTQRAVDAILRALEHKREEGMQDSPWLFPSEDDAAVPVSRRQLDNWMRRTKQTLGINIPRLGYHGEKRAGIRDPNFRRLPAAVQEELAGTTFDTMRRVYDFVELDELKDAVAVLERASDHPAAQATTLPDARGRKRLAPSQRTARTDRRRAARA